ncbi:hypothetical protein [Streptomyces sp. LN590]|uniref:hypothetical protein n=1 Tax=Streptomyces sp. LN590 TaxID=3112980 RepID=UPI0037169DDA
MPSAIRRAIEVSKTKEDPGNSARISGRRHPGKFRLRSGENTTAAALSLVVGVGAGVQVYRVGDSGAKAAWHDGYSATAHPNRD